MSLKNPEVDLFFQEAKIWKKELEMLRSILLSFDLQEELKWGQPCYLVNGKNSILLGGFKEFCVISFFNGVLLPDPEKILVKPGPNTQHGRVIKFRSISEILLLESVLKSYIHAAIKLELEGRKPVKDPDSTKFPEELLAKFKENPNFQKAFQDLTPGKQRAYILYFSGAKQSKTRMGRIEQYLPRILDGKGFHDCVCGLSKRMPTCDGSHKQIQ